MNERKWNGSQWWKFDFHTHTPASSDYVTGQNQREMDIDIAKEWLLGYMRAGIDCVAVTDHNSGAGIDQLKKALSALQKENHADFRQVYLFPGVEISVHGGIHLLAILGCESTTGDIEKLLGAVGYEGTRGSSDGVTTKLFVEVVRAIVLAGGIAIPAHADEDSGLFKQTGATLQQALDHKEIFALELVDQSFSKPQFYRDNKLCWTEVLGSDAHHPTGESGQRCPGSRFTWVKMGEPSLEGLRLALLDGPLSVLRFDSTSGDPNAHGGMYIERIEVEQARYMGRADAFEVRLNPWLNTVIGGRGTGKSTLVEFLRLALRREGELPEALGEDFKKYAQVYQDREESGLLTKETEIRVAYRKDGATYRLQWDPVGKLDPIQEQTAGEWSKAEGDVNQRFPVRMYSQKQIFQMARTPLALLRVIDEAPEVDYASWRKLWHIEASQYLSLRAKIREIEMGLSDESRLKGELQDVKHKLTVFEQSGHAETLKTLQKRHRQLQAVGTWETGLSKCGQRLREIAEELVPEILDDSIFDKASPEDAALLVLVQTITGHIEKVSADVKTLADQADRVVADWQKLKAVSPWQAAVNQAIRAYEMLQERLKNEGVADPTEYGVLVQQRQRVEQQLKEMEGRRAQIVEIKKHMAKCREQVALLRQEITRKRQDFLSEVLKNNKYVRIAVVPYGAKETVEGEFRRLIQRETGGFEKDVGAPGGEGMLGELYRGCKNAGDFEQRLEGLKKWLRDVASEPLQAVVTDKRFATHIARLTPEALDRLDLWFPEDSLDVEYSPSTNQMTFRPIQEGSPGQKTAALLAFLLSYGEEPIIFDQPEDDLDNHLIYDLIVAQLREVKRRRQVIVVTHNANIVVNGDAELVIALTARGGQTQLEAVGCLQEKTVRQTICNILEGGEKAFEQRYRRIALEVRHV